MYGRNSEGILLSTSFVHACYHFMGAKFSNLIASCLEVLFLHLFWSKVLNCHSLSSDAQFQFLQNCFGFKANGKMVIQLATSIESLACLMRHYVSNPPFSLILI
jgi:hypothetical protein